MVRELGLYPALFGYLFQDYITATIARNREKTVIPCVAFVFLNNTLRHFQQLDT